MGVIGRAHYLVHLFSGTKSNHFLRDFRSHDLSQFGHPNRRNFRDEKLSSLHSLKAFQNKSDTLFERDQKSSHSQVGNRQFFGILGQESTKERNDRASRPEHVAVAHHAETSLPIAREIIGRNKELIRDQLGRTVQIDRAGGLISGNSNDLVHPAFIGRINDVFCAENIGLDTFHWVILGGGHLLESSGVDHIINPAHSSFQPWKIAHVAKKKAHRR